MHSFFAPLSDREAVLLLTTLTVGGSQDVAIFEHLPQEARARVNEKAQALLAIPTEKRVPFLVHELKQAFSFKGLRGVERVDPSWLLQGLKGESPRVVATVLISLPGPTVREILQRLPPGIRKRLPPKSEIQRIPVDLVRAVRQIFESRFASMPEPSVKGFAFRDVVQLSRKDIYRLMRELGLVELGQAFVAVGKLALAELCRRLPRDKAEELILAVRGASRVDTPDVKSAQRFLSKVVVNFKDTEEFFQKAGLWRMAKAALLEDLSIREGIRQRLPREAGQLFISFIEKASEIEGEIDAAVLERLQDSILVQIADLARRNIINPSLGAQPMLFHNLELANNDLPPTNPGSGDLPPLVSPNSPETNSKDNNKPF